MTNGINYQFERETYELAQETLHDEIASRASVLDGFTLTDLTAGDSIFTVTVLRANDERQIGKSYTYRVARYTYTDERTGQERENVSVKLLTGPNNLSDYTYMGMLTADNKFRTTRASKVTMDAASAKLFDWLVKRLAAGQHIDSVEILSAGRCLRCGRPLTVADSIRNRYGPVCAGKMGE